MKEEGRENGSDPAGGGSVFVLVFVVVCSVGGVGFNGGSVKMTKCTLSSGIETS